MMKNQSMGFLKSYIDQNAHQAASSPKNDISEPTDDQKKTGNYKKGHINFQGLNIAIENPKGSYRSGTDLNGKQWKTKIHHHYGYIKGTVGKDKDHIDVFIGPKYDSEKVYIVNQKNDKGEFDEHKCMLGFTNIPKALQGYLSNYESGWVNKGLIDSIVEIDMIQFKDWIKNGNTKVKFRSKL